MPEEIANAKVVTTSSQGVLEEYLKYSSTS
jgi:hypothetical protein